MSDRLLKAVLVESIYDGKELYFTMQSGWEGCKVVHSRDEALELIKFLKAHGTEKIEVLFDAEKSKQPDIGLFRNN